ncbi:MAG: rhodanese-like domain-containing protein [Nitrospirota bacterium]|jgi:rhodanese-related sulfurtransferase
MSLRNLSADAKVLGGLGILLLAIIALLNPARREMHRPPVSPEFVTRAIEDGADHVTADDLAHMMIDKVPGLLLVDLRAPADYASYHIDGSINIPLPLLFSDDSLAQLHSAGSTVLISTGGTHAAQAWTLLREQGMENVVTLLGGLNYWMNVFTNPNPPPETAADPEVATFEFRRAVSAHMFGGDRVEAAPAEPIAPPVAPIQRPRRRSKGDEGC